MFKLLFLVGAGFLLFKLIQGDTRKKTTQKDQKDEKLATSGEMVKDPACGTYVPTSTDIRARDGKTTYYFCSYECRDAFLERQKTGEKEE